MQETKDIVKEIVEAVQDRKGKRITIIDLSKVDGASTDTFVICEGRSTAQVSAIADFIREDVQKKTGRKPYNYDGYRNSQWIVIDYGEVMVHVFLPDVRVFYNIEDLWSDGKTKEIPDLD